MDAVILMHAVQRQRGERSVLPRENLGERLLDFVADCRPRIRKVEVGILPLEDRETVNPDWKRGMAAFSRHRDNAARRGQRAKAAGLAMVRSTHDAEGKARAFLRGHKWHRVSLDFFTYPSGCSCTGQAGNDYLDYVYASQLTLLGRLH